MSMVTLVSGGMDSTLMAVLAKEAGVEQFPLFIQYGQLCFEKEINACLNVHLKFNLPKPTVMDVRGFGALISSGLTRRNKLVNEDAFLPGRNLLFILLGASYAYEKGCDSLAIGLLSEEYHIFPDQTRNFLSKSEEILGLSMGTRIQIIAPLMEFSKTDVIKLAKIKGIQGTYSCHSGREHPCGICISCLEIKSALAKGGM